VELTKDVHADEEQEHRDRIALDEAPYKLCTIGNALQRKLQSPDSAADPDQNKGDQRTPVVCDEHSGPAAQLRYQQK